LDKIKKQIKAAKDEKKRVREVLAMGGDPTALGSGAQVILSFGYSVISIAFYYLCGYFSLLMPYSLAVYVSHVMRIDFF
jgi:hypothetical protein